MTLTNYELFTLILAIVGTISSFIYLGQLIKTKIIGNHFTWSDVNKSMDNTINYLKGKSFHPDIVICLGRGGAIYGGLLAGNMGTIRIALIDRKKISYASESMHNPYFLIKPNISVFKSLINNQGKLNILLVTGEVVTGFDLYHAKLFLEDKLEKSQIKNTIMTISFTSLNHASYFPDYADKNEIPNYKSPPWRKNEEYVNDRRQNKIFHRS